MDSYQNLFCRRCYLYDCPYHSGAAPPKVDQPPPETTYVLADPSCSATCFKALVMTTLKETLEGLPVIANSLSQEQRLTLVMTKLKSRLALPNVHQEDFSPPPLSR